MDYRQAGVDIERGEKLVEMIAQKTSKEYTNRVCAGVGDMGGLYKLDDGRLLASSTDGVGTKVCLAQELDIHNTVGIDLVAMNVNDLLCLGARPLFFMDYLAMGKLDLKITSAIIDGILEGCRQSECPLIGGESAEMPDIYPTGVYDLAGFALGEVFPDKVLGGDKVTGEQSIIGIASSGMHSNGYSLIRKLIRKDETKLAKELLTPTRIYWPLAKKLLAKELVSAMVHITGGGMLNIARANKNIDFIIEQTPPLKELPLSIPNYR